MNMSRRKVTRQRHAHLDNVRGKHGNRSLGCNIISSYGGSKIENCFRDIENTLQTCSARYVKVKNYGLDTGIKDIDILISDDGEYVRLVEKAGENLLSGIYSKEIFNNPERDFGHRQKENIPPINETRLSGDNFSDGNDIYVTLRSANIASDDSCRVEENKLHPVTAEEDKNNTTDTTVYPVSEFQAGKLTVNAILEPLSPNLGYQPYLKLEPFSDTESLSSAEVNRKEYLKQLKEFEQSIDGAVWKRNLWQMENKKSNAVFTPHEGAETPESCESIECAGEMSIPETDISEYDDTTGLDFKITGNNDNMSLEDIIQDFLQYYESKRHSVKTHGKSVHTTDDSDTIRENEVCQETDDSQEKMDIGLAPANTENVSQVPYPEKPEDIPPIPPRRSHGDKSRGHRNQYGDQEFSSRNYSEKNAADSHQSDIETTLTSSRSPSIRKRDIMMRRYNSTSVLPIVTPVDMNKNHIMDSRGDYAIPTNGHFDNEIRESKAVNENQSEFNPDEGRFDHTLVHMDIVGESYEARYPWQRDISTQCNLSGCRNSVSSDSVSSGSEWSNYTAANNQNCSNYVNSNYVNNNNTPARRQSSDNIRRRNQVFRTRRPRSMTCLDTKNIYNNTSDMYRSETNLNYRHGRSLSDISTPNSPNRKRMPLLLADDPGSVSDLESILENPHDGNPDRNRSVGGESALTDITSHLRRLEEVRGSLADLSRDNSDPASAWSSSTGEQLRNVLPSPRLSPEMWSEVPEVVVNTERDDYDPGEMLRSMNWNSNFLSVPRKPHRRLSSGSLQSGSDESDNEIAPPVARRGRRAAIVDTKNFGDVSPTQLSPEVSPSNSCDEGETGSNIAERLRRRRSSHDVSMNVYPGDLLVQEHHKKLIKRNTISDFYAGRNGSTPALSEDNKKQRQPFSLLKLMKTRSKESLHLSDVLKELKPSEFKDNHLAAYKNVHWTDLIASTDKQSSAADTLNISEMERKRRESVWELFKSECVFLIDHLMVLKHCFLEPLKKCQVEGFLMYAEPSEIFSNLDELCYVSYTFCKDFISSLLKDMSTTDFGSTAVLIKAFQRFSKHSKDGSVYHTYCLNYTNALSYLEKLRKNDDFCEFEKWCEQDHRCNRLQLADLLIGPMQHCTKLPLLLHNIQKYTEDPIEKTQIVESIEKVEMSLRQLEEKMKWLKNFERVQEIQRHLIWPSITDLDSRAFIPEYLKPKLSRQPCERLLACPSRQLIHEGAITLTESTKSFDAYLFLFDDILLITKIKKSNRKKQSSSDIHSATGQPDNQMYTVHRQPIALDRLGVHDVMPHEAAANGLKCAFVIVQISRFQQIIDVFTLQAASDAIKGTWISQILEVKARCRACSNNKGNSSKENEDPSPTGCGKKGRHGKSLSIDAVFL